jgi:hypothetical protein
MLFADHGSLYFLSLMFWGSNLEVGDDILNSELAFFSLIGSRKDTVLFSWTAPLRAPLIEVVTVDARGYLLVHMLQSGGQLLASLLLHE